jgi:hypothetical protein
MTGIAEEGPNTVTKKTTQKMNEKKKGGKKNKASCNVPLYHATPRLCCQTTGLRAFVVFVCFFFLLLVFGS